MSSLGKYEVIRKYLVADDIIKSILTVKVNNKNTVCVFAAEKPDKVTANNYAIMKMKEISGGYLIEDQVEFNLIGKDLDTLLAVKDRIIELLDDPRNSKTIKDTNTTILTSQLVNGGGIAKNYETKNFHIVVYFQIKTIKTKGAC